MELTQEETQEIVDWIESHPGSCTIDQDEDGWSIVMLRDGAMFGVIHPRAFLDVIRS
jgi:hypothetical protein